MSRREVWAPLRHAGARVPWAWVRMLGAHGTLTREMNANLIAAHELTLTDYEVLLRLWTAPEVGLTRSDLAQSTLLTQGGITRLLSGLERAGLVESASGETDRRVVYARLTEAGRKRFREAARTHVRDITTMFTERFSSDELATLADLLGRLPGKSPPAHVPRVPGAPPRRIG